MTPIRYLSTENTPEIQLYCPLLVHSFLNNSSDFWSGTKNLDEPKTYFGTCKRTRHKLQVLRCPHCGCLRIQILLLEEGSHVVKFCTSSYSNCVSFPSIFSLLFSFTLIYFLAIIIIPFSRFYSPTFSPYYTFHTPLYI